MDKIQTYISTTIIATIIGFMVLTVFLGIGFFAIVLIIEILVPLRPPQFIMDFGSRFAPFVISLAFLYFFGLCITGFTIGFYVNKSRLRTKSDDTAIYVWQSLISSFIVGITAPLLILFASNRPGPFLGDFFMAFVFALPTIVASVVGYKFHFYKQGFKGQTTQSFKRLIISSLIGSILFMILRVLFDPIIGTECSIFSPTSGLFFDTCTESKMFFGIILCFSGFIAGWWNNVNKHFEYGIISGFIVGIVGPLLGSFMDSKTGMPMAGMVMIFLFYGVFGSLFGLIGGVCSSYYQYWRYGFAESV